MVPIHPVRLFLGKSVYWLIWAPAVAVALPFAIVGAVVRLCADRLFPTLAGFAQPAWGAVHDLARYCGNRVAGYPTKKAPAHD